MGRNRKYFLDLTDLQFKQIRLPWSARLRRFMLWFSISVAIAVFYGYLFEKQFGSPKEKMLREKIESMKLEYALLGREMDNSVKMLNSLRVSDDQRYRPILDMDSVPQSYRKGGIGGTERFTELKGFQNSDFLISYRTKIEVIKNMANVQTESFESVSEKTAEWKRYNDHLPAISPVSVQFRLGDGYRFRPIHPIWGTPRMHNGQDFEVPYGTDVYATGDGTVIESGYNTGGFGNYVVIDHNYGLQSLYGHLSEIRVTKGENVKRGDLIGISGRSGASTGPHLHYQIEQQGHAINPAHFINNEMDLDFYNEMIQAFGSRSKLR